MIANKSAYNIRVANLSVGAAVTTFYNNDPLTLAAKRAVEAGVVVVTAAGNLGKNPYGRILRRHHGSRQRALGADRRRVEPRGNDEPVRRRDGHAQLARAHGRRLLGEAGRRGAWHGH